MKSGREKPARKPTAREAALDILTRVEQEHAYSNLLLNQTLQKYRLDRLDAALATEIVYGTIQRLNTIDYFLDRFVKNGMAKLDPWVRNLLRLSFYQLYYLERIPAHAAVSEAVNIAKRKGHQGISGMVNAVLRNVVRQKERLVIPAGLNAVQRISLAHSHPEWMVSRWMEQYGEHGAEQICASNNAAPKVAVRVNTLKQKRDKMMETMRRAGLTVVPSRLAESGIVVESGGNMALTPWYANGDVSVQDESSMLVAEIVRPEPGSRVLDCCAAPGGKTAHMAELMNDDGEIWACDIHAHKEKLIRDQAKRLGLRCVKTLVSDAMDLPRHFPDHSFDYILLDAPCSGLGVIRRKPDVKWTKQEPDIVDISALQYGILSEVQRLLRPGGVLVYSTCTIEHEENRGLIERFLRQFDSFEPDASIERLIPAHVTKQCLIAPGMLQILPHQFQSDGFFIARLKRTTETE